MTSKIASIYLAKATKIIMMTCIIILSSICYSLAFAKVKIIGTWGGAELDAFKKIVHASGVQMSFETTRDLNAVLATRLKANSLPDIAILPNPGMLKQLARKRVLTPLSFLNKSNLKASYSNSWLSLGSYGGKLYGIYFKVTNKSVIWYNPKEFIKNNWTIPTDWKELLSLNQQIVSKGKTPWSIGADIGWPLTDWIENVFVRTAGPSEYEKWYTHEIPWTHPHVKTAFEKFGQIVGKPKNIVGGVEGMLATSFQNAAAVVFQARPSAYLYFEGDFIGGIMASQFPKISPGETIDFFPFPSINPKFDKSVVIGGDSLVLFSNSAEAKKLMQFLTSRKANLIAAKNGFLQPHKEVKPSDYPTLTMRRSATILAKAENTVFDASDLMPPAVGNQGGFWNAVPKYAQNPAALPSILQEMENLARKNY